MSDEDFYQDEQAVALARSCDHGLAIIIQEQVVEVCLMHGEPSPETWACVLSEARDCYGADVAVRAATLHEVLTWRDIITGHHSATLH